MYMRTKPTKPVIKKKVLKKAPIPAMILPKVLKKAPIPAMILPKPGKYAAPVPNLPLGMKDGAPALRKDFRYPNGVSKERMVEAFVNVLFVNKKKLILNIEDLYPALMNRVKDYCNVYDLIRYESSTKDTRIRKNLERTMKALRDMGYLSPINPENTVTLLKIPPPGIKL
jgi:hypothetical protein